MIRMTLLVNSVIEPSLLFEDKHYYNFLVNVICGATCLLNLGFYFKVFLNF